MALSGIFDNQDSDGGRDSGDSVNARRIIVANFLPLHSHKDETGKWCFSWDEDALLLQLKAGMLPEMKVFYVGRLKVNINESEQDDVALCLYEEFRCVPTFLAPDVERDFYHGFCKHQLWPLFHDMLPACLTKGDLFSSSLYLSYVAANQKFAEKVMEVVSSNDDFVWVHDYHLMLLPSILRRRLNRIKLGFFLHSPFPSSEIFRTLPVREEVLRGLLNADLIGFHTFDYARHFLNCCGRMLGLNCEAKRGYLDLDYLGRIVKIKILPVGVHVGRLQSVLDFPETISKIQDIEQAFKGKKLILGIDDMDIFKGISLKLMAMEALLEGNPQLRGKVVLVQIVNPARSTGNDVEDTRSETYSTAERINLLYGNQDYTPVVLIDNSIPFYEKCAFYTAADCCIVNAVRDGMNLIPYEYSICRQGSPVTDRARGIPPGARHMSTLIVSEFVGCSPSLSGSFRVNPWSVDEVADALYRAIVMPASEKQLRHEKHYRYVSSHDVAYWSRSFLQDLEKACRNHFNKRYWSIGLGFKFKLIALSPEFRKLSIRHIVPSYEKASRRVIFLDYDGTIVPESSIRITPSEDVISILKSFCSDPKNTVFVVSGRSRSSLSEWFSSCESLGIAAEHGYFIRWDKSCEWEVSTVPTSDDWRAIAEPVMQVYTETTDGSYIESKETAIVWQYQDADADFGSCQAKELSDHLESVLSKEPVVVKMGQHIVEVKPQRITKGSAVEKLLEKLLECGEPPDFIMCIGDDCSDEDMFKSIYSMTSSNKFPSETEVFACTVGQKPSQAKYYVDSADQVISLLKDIISPSGETLKPSGHSCFETLTETFA